VRRSIIAALLAVQTLTLYAIVVCTLQLANDLPQMRPSRLGHLVGAAERRLALLHLHRERHRHGG
jgi:hypothetical protein